MPKAATLTEAERERMNQLCLRIQEEKNPKAFENLVRELNDLLENKQERVQKQASKPV